MDVVHIGVRWITYILIYLLFMGMERATPLFPILTKPYVKRQERGLRISFLYGILLPFFTTLISPMHYPLGLVWNRKYSHAHHIDRYLNRLVILLFFFLCYFLLVLFFSLDLYPISSSYRTDILQTMFFILLLQTIPIYPSIVGSFFMYQMYLSWKDKPKKLLWVKDILEISLYFYPFLILSLNQGFFVQKLEMYFHVLQNDLMVFFISSAMPVLITIAIIYIWIQKRRQYLWYLSALQHFMERMADKENI